MAGPRRWGRAALLALLAIGAALRAPGAAAVDCSQWQVCDPRPRRILFIMDASLSIAQEHFDKDMVDFVVNTFCGFRDYSDGASYEVGVITFNQLVETRIPFGSHKQNEFEKLMKKKVKDKTPLRCCTPHAEAAILAKEMFEEAHSKRPGFENIAFFISDGAPYMNYLKGKFGVGTNKKSRKFYESRGLKYKDWDSDSHLVWTQGGDPHLYDELRVTYGTRNVPFAMRDLKEAGVRVFFIGVPHNEAGRGVNIDYFTGELDDDEVCYENKDVTPPETSCGIMEYKPLVSEPTSQHAFRVESWDLNGLVDQSLDIICRENSDPGGRPTISLTPTVSPTPFVCPKIPRDLMILVDTSESMDPERFSNEMMEVVKYAAAQLDFSVGSRVGVATFGSTRNLKIRLPLSTYSDLSEFNAAVEKKIANRKLECCTSFAEAFVMVREHFSENFLDGQDKILLVVTDGTPYQNYGNGRWEWNTHGRALTRCEYTTFAVPQQAGVLRGDGVRIVLAGVPNLEGRPPMADFFDGALEGEQCCVNLVDNTACLVDGDNQWCVDNYNFDDTDNIKCIEYSSARVVSEGEHNIFTTDSWDLTGIKEGISELICRADVTPTNPPTPKPDPGDDGSSGGSNKPPGTGSLVDGLDLILVLDSGELSDAQRARCEMEEQGTSCLQRLVQYADDVRAELANVSPLRVAALTSDCFATNVLGANSPFKSTGRQQDNLMSALGDTALDHPSCRVPGMVVAKSLVEELATDSPVVVLLLTHDAEAVDGCSLGQAVSDVSDLSSGVKLLAATIGGSKAHLDDLDDAFFHRNVFSAFSPPSALVARVEQILG